MDSASGRHTAMLHCILSTLPTGVIILQLRKCRVAALPHHPFSRLLENINQALCVRNFVDICGDAFIKDYAKSVYGVGYISHDDGQVVELMSESYEKFYSVFFLLSNLFLLTSLICFVRTL